MRDADGVAKGGICASCRDDRNNMKHFTRGMFNCVRRDDRGRGVILLKGCSLVRWRGDSTSDMFWHAAAAVLVS